MSIIHGGASDYATGPSAPDIDALETVCPECDDDVIATVIGWDGDWAELRCPENPEHTFWQQVIYDPWEG